MGDSWPVWTNAPTQLMLTMVWHIGRRGYRCGESRGSGWSVGRAPESCGAAAVLPQKLRKLFNGRAGPSSAVGAAGNT